MPNTPALTLIALPRQAGISILAEYILGTYLPFSPPVNAPHTPPLHEAPAASKCQVELPPNGTLPSTRLSSYITSASRINPPFLLDPDTPKASSNTHSLLRTPSSEWYMPMCIGGGVHDHEQSISIPQHTRTALPFPLSSRGRGSRRRPCVGGGVQQWDSASVAFRFTLTMHFRLSPLHTGLHLAMWTLLDLGISSPHPVQIYIILALFRAFRGIHSYSFGFQAPNSGVRCY